MTRHLLKGKKMLETHSEALEALNRAKQKSRPRDFF